MMRAPAGRTLVLDVLPATFLWGRHLPAHDGREFSSIWPTRWAPPVSWTTRRPSLSFAEWRHTPEVRADAEPHAALTTDLGENYGPLVESGAPA